TRTTAIVTTSAERPAREAKMARRRRLMAIRLAGLRRRSLRVAREAVVRNRLPVGRVRGELAIRGSDTRVVVEEAHADGRGLSGGGIDAPEGRAARGAEGLWEPVSRLVGADEVFARGDADRARDDSRLGRRCCSRALLAAGAVAVARGDRWLAELEADALAE